MIAEDDDGFVRLQDVANIGINAGPAFGAMSVIAALYRAKATGEPACMEIAQSDAAAYFDWYRIEGFHAYQQSDEFVTGLKSCSRQTGAKSEERPPSPRLPRSGSGRR